MTASPVPRRTVIAGNWKMNPATQREAVTLATDVADRVQDMSATTVVCPPAVWLIAKILQPGRTWREMQKHARKRRKARARAKKVAATSGLC